MNINNEELQNEKNYLEKVKNVLLKKIDVLTDSVDDKKSEINEMKKFMWDNLTDYTDEERAISLSSMDLNVDITNMSIDTLVKYKKALNSPYFGKLTFLRDDGRNINVYVGISSIEENFNFYVFDWRSPISSLFYNYEVGKAKYDCPNGEITGEITSKMQFKIVDGELLRCFKSDVNIDDDYLQEILANSSTEKMKNIVSTIQREQNLIIRNDKDKYMIVQGIAGSGKTSVALHRIAYLLYKDIHLKYNNVLILSPNEVFSDYISNVLPELGEQNVMKTTFSDFALNFLKPYKNIESYSDFLERMYSNSSYDKDVINYKMSDNYKTDIDKYLKNINDNTIFTSDISFKNIVFTKNELYDLYTKKYEKFPLKERIELMAESICLGFKVPVKKNISKIKKQIIDNSNIKLNMFEIYSDYINSNEKTKNEKNSQKFIRYEDIAPLIYLYFKINGYPVYNEIRQVVIDEVQDYTLFQIEILKQMFKNASFTLLGDVNQSINPHYSYESLNALGNIFNDSLYLELSKTYRSSEEIIDYSNKILGLDNACSVRRNNNIPVELKKDIDENNLNENINNTINLMNNNGINRIAIITRDVQSAKKINKIINNEKFQLITKATDSISSELIILPSYLSKGLEFDGVIVINDYNNSYCLEEQKLYYVVCTRAQHQLSIYNEPTKILKK